MQPELPRVSVIVLNYNGSRVIRPCLESLRRQSFREFEVVVVDNASTDASLAIVTTEFPEARTIALESNVGFCRANNIAIAATSAEYVALLNNDTEVSPDWLRSLVETLDADPSCGFCASRMIRIDDRTLLDSAGDVFYSHGVAGKRGEGMPAAAFSTPDYVFGACAGAAIYRRSLFDAVGMLDPEFGSMDEDVDLSFRAQLASFKCRYVPRAVVYHHVGASFNRVPHFRVRLARRNSLTILLKNVPRQVLMRKGFRMLGYILLGDIRWILKGYAAAVISARWDNVRSLPRTLRVRRQIQETSTISARELEAMLTPSSALGIARRMRGVQQPIQEV